MNNLKNDLKNCMKDLEHAGIQGCQESVSDQGWPTMLPASGLYDS
jgi:hypothetical protein